MKKVIINTFPSSILCQMAQRCDDPSIAWHLENQGGQHWLLFNRWCDGASLRQIGTIFQHQEDSMSKVFENTSSRIVIYSDNGAFKLIACRRAISEEHQGVIRYYGSKWFINTYQRKGNTFVPYQFTTGLRYVVRKKQEIIEMLSKSIRFTQAYSEMREK